MSANWIDKFVKCPFYHKSTPGQIACEGFGEVDSFGVGFKDRGEKVRFMKERCESIEGCHLCHIHALLERLNDE